MNRRQWLKGAMAAGTLLAAGGAASGIKGPFREPQPLPEGPIIDMHVHTAGIGAGGSGCYLSPVLRNNWRYRVYLKAFGTTQAELEQNGDKYAVDLLARRLAASQKVSGAVVLALDGVVTRGQLDRAKTEVYIPNDFVAAQVQRHPQLHFGASVNPYRQDALSRLEQAKSRNAVLLKWLPNIQGIRPDDPALRDFYRQLVQLDLPLLTHVGDEHSFSRSDNALADPRRLRLPLEMGVRVIAAHAGFSGSRDGIANVDRLLGMMPQFDRLFADISSLTQINKHFALQKVLAAGVDDRLLFGTDMPLINTPLVTPWQYLAELPFSTVRQIAAQASPWDRDVALKQALGVPAEVFLRPAKFLNINI